MNKWLFLFLACTLHTGLFAKVRILTFHVNHADLIEYQYRTLKKFLLDDFELIVFNDAKTEENEEWIEQVCRANGIQCVRFQQEWHFTDPLNAYLMKVGKDFPEDPTSDQFSTNEKLASHPSVCHSHVIQYALDHYGYDHDDIVVIMDGDHFIIDYLSIRELLRSFDLVGANRYVDLEGQKRQRLEIAVPDDEAFLWVVFIAFDPRKLPDVRDMHFHVDTIQGHPSFPDNTICDTGAALHKYLKKHPNLKIQSFSVQRAEAICAILDPEPMRHSFILRMIDDIYPRNVQFFLFEHCLHLENVSWGIDSKLQYVMPFLNNLLKAG